MALGRAAYSGAAVQLLDDPLGAVDPRVGRQLFDRWALLRARVLGLLRASALGLCRGDKGGSAADVDGADASPLVAAPAAAWARAAWPRAVAPLAARRCIGPGGLMASATRVLVTHQRQVLPRCDRVLVLRQGRPLALGTWQEVAALQLPELTAGARLPCC